MGIKEQIPYALEQEHKAILKGIKYTGAIKHYAKKRQDFLSFYNNGIKVDNKHLQNSGAIGQAIQEINSKNIKQQRNFINNTLVPEIEKTTRKNFDNQNPSIFNEIRSLLKDAEEVSKKEAEILKDKANKELDKLMTEIFANQDFEQMIIDKCKDQLFEGSYDLKDLESRARTLRKNMILNLIQGKDNISKTDWLGKSIMAGYFRESIVASAFGKILGKAAQQSGNRKITKTIDGKNKKVESAIDVIISDIQDIEKLLQALEGDVVEGLNIKTDKSFGIQVKSWNSDRDKYESDLSIGSRKNLLNLLEKKGSWMAGALVFKHTENILEALGKNNVAWVTGDKFYFTDDFIKRMRQKEYFINFIYQKSGNSYKATNKIRWQKYGTFFD